MRPSTNAVLSIALAAACGWIFYAKATEGGQTYGPLPCSACRLETPMPGPGTQTFLDTWAWDVRHTAAVWTQIVVKPNDKVVVCNGTACVTYTMTDSNSYLGGKATPQTSTPGGGGGVGSGTGNGRGQGVGTGGGANPPGGSYGGGGWTGTVSAGPGSPLPKLPKGSQEI